MQTTWRLISCSQCAGACDCGRRVFIWLRSLGDFWERTEKAFACAVHFEIAQSAIADSETE